MADKFLDALDDDEQVILHLKGWSQINWWLVSLAVLAFASISLITEKGELESLWSIKLAIGGPLVAVGYAVYQFRRVLLITDRRILYRKWGETGGRKEVKLSEIEALNPPGLFVIPGLHLDLVQAESALIRQYTNLHEAYTALRIRLSSLNTTELTKRAFDAAHRIEGSSVTAGCLTVFLITPAVFRWLLVIEVDPDANSFLLEIVPFVLILACAFVVTELIKLLGLLCLRRGLAVENQNGLAILLMKDPVMRTVASSLLGIKLDR